LTVTINTDASFFKIQKQASFAFTIVCDAGRTSKSGMIQQEVKRPEVAEFMSIINAFYVLGRKHYPNITKVIVNTDCLNVIHVVQNNVQAIRKYHLSFLLELLKKYNKVLSAAMINKEFVEFRHVKAHKNTDTKRNYTNDILDKEAKKVLKASAKKQ
jgi:ribonuclease HI